LPVFKENAMSKIVILAKGKDADKVNDALADSGLDFDVVEPTPSNLLHIVIGMVDDEEEDTERKTEKVEPTDVEPAPTDTTTPSDEETPPTDEVTEEGLEVKLDGLAVRGFLSEDKSTVLFVPAIARTGTSKMSVCLNEAAGSTINFYCADNAAPTLRTLITVNGVSYVTDVLIRENSAISAPVLRIGKR
jgi:hypothetical protein